MTKTITLIDTSDTFQVWLNRTNEIANAISQFAVTSDSDANGSVTSGNAQHTGIFSGNTVAVKTTLRGGNVQSTGVLSIGSNVALGSNKMSTGTATTNTVVNSTSFTVSNSTVSFSYIAPTAVQKADNKYFLNANGSFSDPHVGITAHTVATGAELVDSWDTSDLMSVEYTLTVKANSSNNHQMSKILMTHDNGDVFFSEYGLVQSNGSVGAYSANLSGSTARLYFTAGFSNCDFRIMKIENDDFTT